MFSTNSDAALRYEGLARTAFDCGRGGGPGNIANADFCAQHFGLDVSEEGKNALKEILSALLDKVNGSAKEELKNILNSFNQHLSKYGVELIDYIIKICEADK